jgi:hypothetical protein
MKKYISLLILFLFCFVELYAQRGLYRRSRSTSANGPSYRFHSDENTVTLTGDFPGAISFSFLLGPSFIGGDMAGPVSSTFALNYNLMSSIAVNHIFPGNIGYKISYMFGYYKQSDFGSPLYEMNGRNYHINTSLSEVGIHGQYYIFGGPYADDQTHNLYVSLGVGILLNNSIKTSDSDTIPTSIYKKNSSTIDFPFTLGYKYNIGNNMFIGAEFCERYAMGDYVDGLKPKVGNYANDIITHFALTFTYNFYKGR